MTLLTNDRRFNIGILAGIGALSRVLCCCLLVITPLAYAEDTWNIDQLMQLLASKPSAHARFTETKSIAILDKPVASSGELFYTAPNRLEKRTLAPKPESMLLDDHQLTITQRGKTRVLSLQRYPEIAVLVDSIRGTLAGDKQALEQAYALNLEGDEQQWSLQLLPRQDKMKKVVASILMGGAGGELTTIAIKQADGDSSLMTITPLTTP